ncbi:hypothetical protein HWB90_gp011 [Mycobacterium phage Fowlmouth]|uniref:Uncharacterized protein n=1 Tax=Mycobacterium phage Fowlmouth TaxID=2419978 RepID=A0A3G2KG89_9CAUD|nr:hypothetical protein HWB90_gp011 [Mycobacterium phage Fowlmouth]AYN57961.1 hypothetical protein SEA_FOWLMOUTH_11 [Mycobacterium phage Fowlmouth]
MSRNIENDHPFTQDEIDYLLSRSGGEAIVKANRRDFPEKTEASKDEGHKESHSAELDPDIVEFVKGLEKSAVDAELEKLGIETQATELKEKKLELAKALQAKRDAE